jgi:transcriptional regulator with XRE-family HTH domain
MIYATMVDALAARRIALKISQSDLDQICGFTTGQIGKWECGERRPNTYNLCVWASALNAVMAVAALDSPSRAQIAARAPWRQGTEAA